MPAIWLKHTMLYKCTSIQCIIDGKVFIENFSFDYLSVHFRLRGHKHKDYNNSNNDRAKKETFKQKTTMKSFQLFITTIANTLTI